MPFDELVDVVAAILEEEQPTVVGTFGPDGIFAHPDHIAIGAATDAAFARHARTSGTAFRRLLHSAIPNAVFERWQQQRAEKGLWLFDPTQVYHMRGVPDEEIGLVVDCRSVAHRTVAGLREHKSQHHVMTDDPDDVDRLQRIMSRDWAMVAGPNAHPGHRCWPICSKGFPDHRVVEPVAICIASPCSSTVSRSPPAPRGHGWTRHRGGPPCSSWS